jgi:hypothetical protein
MGDDMKNIEKLMSRLPKDYEATAKTTKALVRARGIKNSRDLMLLCLIYLFKGLTLLEVSVYASVENIANISNVAFMKRFAKCRDWFRHIATNLHISERLGYAKPSIFDTFRIIAVDASDIVQRGKLKLEFHLHYAYDIFNMRTVEYKFTNNKVGETLKNFTMFTQGDLIIADRAYGTLTSILHCISLGADYIFRMKYNAFSLYEITGEKFNITKKLADATNTKSVDFIAYFKNGKQLTPIRICAIKKNEDGVAKSEKRIKRRESKNQTTYSDDSKLMNHYIVVATSLQSAISAKDILELYRYRWQVELFFKRAKSLLQLGNLPDRKEENILAWLDGKMLCAMLIESLQAEVDFSPKELC